MVSPCIFLLLLAYTSPVTPKPNQSIHLAALEAVPPNVSLAPLTEKISGPSVNISTLGDRSKHLSFLFERGLKPIHIAGLDAVPPSITVAPQNKKQKLTGPSVHINPFLTNSLLQALIEDSDRKKRVQRYRDLYRYKVR